MSSTRTNSGIETPKSSLAERLSQYLEDSYWNTLDEQKKFVYEQFEIEAPSGQFRAMPFFVQKMLLEEGYCYITKSGELVTLKGYEQLFDQIITALLRASRERGFREKIEAVKSNPEAASEIFGDMFSSQEDFDNVANDISKLIASWRYFETSPSKRVMQQSTDTLGGQEVMKMVIKKVRKYLDEKQLSPFTIINSSDEFDKLVSTMPEAISSDEIMYALEEIMIQDRAS